MNMRLVIKVLLFITFFSSVAFAETMNVITKENSVREDCKFLAPVKAKVRYGDRLEVLSKEGDWFRVKFRNIRGCIHKGAVTEKSVSLSGVSGTGSSASADEVSLAGKGFNPEVERSYRNKHPELNFRTVDGIEQYKISEEALRKFIRNGDLNQP